MAEATNPWSYSGWNKTDQSIYVRTYGIARAEARARDAGTTMTGPRPPGGEGPKPRVYAEVAMIRPGNPPIYRFLVPAKRDTDDVRIIDTGDVRVVPEGDVRKWTP